MDEFSRTRLLLGSRAMEKLSGARVAVFGIGGVGGYVCEGLARSGVGAFDLIDNDTVSVTNINRQIIAAQSTLGAHKCDVMKARMLDINPSVNVTVHKCFFLPENADDFDFTVCDYVVDAVDTVAAKLEIITRAKAAGVPVISCMGAGNKLDPSALKVADISRTKVCPLARVMRRELKKRGVEHLKVVYSEEPPVRFTEAEEEARECETEALPQENKKEVLPRKNEVDALPREEERGGKRTPGSVAFVPSVAGLLIASEVVKDLIK